MSADPYAGIGAADPYAGVGVADDATSAQSAPNWIGLGGRAVMRGASATKDFFQDVIDRLLPSAPAARALAGAVAGSATGTHPNNAPTADQAATGFGLPSPQTPAQRAFSKGVEFATQAALAPEAAEAAGLRAGVTAAAKRALPGAAAGVAYQGAGEVGAPEVLKDAAALAAGAATGAAPVAVRVTSRAAEPFAAAVSPRAAEAAAARAVASSASDPAAAATALESSGEIVPGSQPTTFQQTGDLGLGQLEREKQTQHPELFAQRRADQNAARVQAVGALEDAGDPAAVSAHLRDQFDQIDADTHDRLLQNLTAAQSRAEAMGGNATPEELGAGVRGALDDAEKAAKAQERALWKAVDPDGTLTGNVTETRQAAQDIVGGVSSTAKPVSGEELAVFDAASSLPNLAPVSDLIDLRSRVSAEMRHELLTAGSTPTYARLTQLRSAIQSNLADSIANAVAHDDQAVQRGMIRPEDSVATKLQAVVDNWKQQRAQSGGVVGANAGATSAPGRTGGVPRMGGAGSEGPGGSGVAPGNPGLSGEQPSFDAAAKERLDAASAATKARAQAFGLGPNSVVLKRDGTADRFRLPDGAVPKQYFHPGVSGYTDMQALLSTADRAAVMPIIEDYAALTLKRAAAGPDGVIDPARFQRWRNAYQDALRALPPATSARFRDAAEAGRAVAEATGARKAALAEVQTGAVGRVMGLSDPHDVIQAVGRILTGSTPGRDMLALAKATVGNEAARQGLRRAAAQFMAQRFVGNTEVAASGVGAIRADALQSFVRKAKPALNLIFSPEEVRSMEAVAEDVQRAGRSTNAIKIPGNSNTAQDFGALWKTVSKGKSLLSGLAGVAGATHGVFGAAAGFAGTWLLQTLHAAGVHRIDQLVTEAMLDPALAHQLLRRAPATLNDQTARPLAAALWGARAGAYGARQQGN